MILIPILLTIAVTIATFSEPAPVKKTTDEIYKEQLGQHK